MRFFLERGSVREEARGLVRGRRYILFWRSLIFNVVYLIGFG